MLRFLWAKLQNLAGMSPPQMEGKRSSKWPKVRNEHLKVFNWCAVCCRLDDLEVHHVIPVYVDPLKELEPDNLITLCRPTCHFLIGHLNNWSSYNRHVRKDAELIRNRILSRP